VLIGLPFPLSATFLPAAGCLPFFKARVGNEQAATKSAPLHLWHKGFSPGLQTLHEPSMRAAEAFGMVCRRIRSCEGETMGNSEEEGTAKGEEKGKGYILLSENRWSKSG
jgi:hypothetical protein